MFLVLNSITILGLMQCLLTVFFAQFHAPQTTEMKQEILKQLCSQKSTIHVVFATVAIGMGVDIPDIRQIIHVGPPCSMKAYFQETGRAGDWMANLHLLAYIITITTLARIE